MLRPMPGRSLTWEIPKFLRIRWRVPVARSRFPCLGMGVRRPFAGFTPQLVGSICLPLESAAQDLQLSAHFPVGHAVTVRLPSRLRRGLSPGAAFPFSFRSWMMPWATAKRLFKVSSGVSPHACSPAGWGSLPSTSSLRSPQGREECSPAGRCPSLLLRIGLINGEVSSIVLFWNFSFKGRLSAGPLVLGVSQLQSGGVNNCSQ